MIRSANALLYSVSAAKRIFKVPAGVRVRVVKFWRCMWVWIEGQRPRFVSLAVFKQHFAQWRMKQALQLEAQQLERGLYAVRNPAKGSQYLVGVAASGPVCECEDFSNQEKFFAGKGVCKHGYAVLRSLGYGSLSSFLSK